MTRDLLQNGTHHLRLQGAQLTPGIQMEKRQLMRRRSIPPTVSNDSTRGTLNTEPNILERERGEVIVIRTQTGQSVRVSSTKTLREDRVNARGAG